MDLDAVTALLPTRTSADVNERLRHWCPGDAWLAGGTWLFSEPQPALRRLIDLSQLDWTPIEVRADGIEIAATCTLAELQAVPASAQWPGVSLLARCCRALLGSFKVWHEATVGGNICLALPAAPMVSLAAGLDGVGQIWSADGGQRSVPIADLVVGAGRTALAEGDLLRSVFLPAVTLADRVAFRQMSLNPHGRSAALLIGRAAASGAVTLTVTAATVRPVQLRFAYPPTAEQLSVELAAQIKPELYFADGHGSLSWRRQLTAQLAEQIRLELAAAGPAS